MALIGPKRLFLEVHPVNEEQNTQQIAEEIAC